MKYRADLRIDGYIEIEADSEEDAMARVLDGYSLNDVTVEDDEVGEISVVIEIPGNKGE